MKSIHVQIFFFMGIFLLACTPAENNHSQDKPEIVGAYRDANDCVSSAGYVWSSLMQDCIRTFEIGKTLIDAQNAEATLAASIIVDEKHSAIELFLPEGGALILRNIAPNVWQDKNGNFTAQSDFGYSVYDGVGTLLFTEEAVFAEPEEDGLDDDDIREFGRVVTVEDGVYPMFVVTVEFPERGFQESFNLNVEAVTTDVAALSGMAGKYATIHYTSDLETYLMEMKFGEQFLLGGSAGDVQSEWKTITGILGDAESESMGDLPDKVSVKDAEGNRLSFDEYIPPEMVLANGKTVTAYYTLRTNNVITKIMPVEE